MKEGDSTEKLVESLVEELNCETVFTIPVFGGIAVDEGVVVTWIIMAVLTALTLITTITIGLLLYNRFKMAMKQTAVSNAESMVESTVDKLDAELLNVRQIMNAVNYNIIQENDISSDDFNRQFSLLYEINTDKVQSMALYDSNGAQLMAEPVSERKKGVKASEQDWYTNAEVEIENVHFSQPLPVVQNPQALHSLLSSTPPSTLTKLYLD